MQLCTVGICGFLCSASIFECLARRRLLQAFLCFGGYPEIWREEEIYNFANSGLDQVWHPSSPCTAENYVKLKLMLAKRSFLLAETTLCVAYK